VLIAAVAAIALVALALAWWVSRRPSNAGDWQRDVARVATAHVDGDRATVRNFRDFRYRSASDIDERWEERSLDLSQVDGLDIFVIYWGSSLISHTILSWSFADGRHLAISVETRKRKGQDYSTIAGFFRQYTLIYVVADERDVVKLRTHVRGHEVYLYRLQVTRAAARALLMDYVGAMNALARKPRWYNALVTNCTTVIRRRAIHAGGKVPLSWKIFANGYLPELLYERGSLDQSLPYQELRAASRINERAHAPGTDEDFSVRIRSGLPMAPLRS
jgi:hypothetical protein